MSETYRSILKLRAVRHFTDDPVTDEDLKSLLQAARWTGSSKNRQLWSFVVIDDPVQKDQLCEAGDFMTPVRNAPIAICLVQEPDGYEFDTGRVAQNVMLAADAIGLASCPVTLHREDVARQVLGLPSDRRCRYAIAIGHPDPTPRRSAMSGRKPLEELTHRNTYGG